MGLAAAPGRLSGGVVKGMQTTLRLILDFAIYSTILGKMPNFPETQYYQLLISMCESLLHLFQWDSYLRSVLNWNLENQAEEWVWYVENWDLVHASCVLLSGTS